MYCKKTQTIPQHLLLQSTREYAQKYVCIIFINTETYNNYTIKAQQ